MGTPDAEHKDASLGTWGWLLPATYSVHVAEEAFGGHGLMQWMAAGGGERLSMAEFVGVNAVGVAFLCLAAWAARRSTAWRWLLVVGAAIIFVNGLSHAAVCAATRTYVPGLWTGVFLYVPLGGILLFRLGRVVPLWLFASAAVCGLVIHGVVLWLVLRMPGFRFGEAAAGLFSAVAR